MNTALLVETACDATSWPDALVTVTLIIAGAVAFIFLVRGLFG